MLVAGWGDGLKNYFTLQTYVAQPAAHGLWRYTGMAYPFGDYIYYTDNTPLFAIPFRWLCLHVHDWSAYAAPVFITLVLLNIPLCGVLIYSVFRRCIGHGGLAFAAAVLLPWINPMLPRLAVGNHNMSVSAMVLAGFWLVLRWQESVAEGRRRRWLIAGGPIALIVAGFLTHVYFMPILAGLWTVALLTWTIRAYGLRQNNWKAGALATVAVPLAAAMVIGVLLEATDGFASMRTHRDMGYDWMEMKTRFWTFFSHYTFQRVYFPVEGPVPGDVLDRACYLGSVGLWLMSGLIVAMLVQPSLRTRFGAAQRAFWNHPVMMPLAVASLVLLSISFGERYQTGPEGPTLVNIFNPFLYLRPLVPKLENFRALARFSWPFFFTFYLWLLHTARVVFAEWPGRSMRTVLAAALMILGGLEVKDFVDFLQSRATNPSPLSTAAQQRDFSMPRIDFKRYQALVPLPLYVVGAEDGDLIIDDADEWTTKTFTLALRSRLPLMSVKLSRTPKLYSRALLQTFAADRMPAFMRRRMDNRPVLIAYSRVFAADSSGAFVPPPARQAARTAYFAALDFPRRHGLVSVDSVGDVLFYAWPPPPLPAPR